MTGIPLQRGEGGGEGRRGGQTCGSLASQPALPSFEEEEECRLCCADLVVWDPRNQMWLGVGVGE